MTSSYKKVSLDPGILDAALERARSLPVFEGSHRKREANIVGCIGEVLFERLLQHYDVSYVDERSTTRHDYVVNGSLSVEVKTKDRTVQPRIHFDNSVPLYNHEHQRPDFYFFVSLVREKTGDEGNIRRFKTGFLLGGIDLQTLDRVGKKWDAGQTDPSNGTTFWTACINVGMRDLLSTHEMIKIFRRFPT